MTRFTLLSLAALVSTLCAAPLTVVSYDMPNGSGQASSGSFNYWDLNYTGSGATSTDGAPLTGGVGDLTDGTIVTGVVWTSVENAAGTGPYVGWQIGRTPDVLMTFRFGSVVTVNSITLYSDDSDIGGVSVPLSVDIGVSGGPLTNYPLANPPGGTTAALTFSGLNLAGNAIDIRANYRDSWLFLSEITFDGTTSAGVPEPAGVGLLAVGLMALAIRRLRSRAASER